MVDKKTYEENKRLCKLTLSWLGNNYDKWEHGDLEKGEAYVLKVEPSEVPEDVLKGLPLVNEANRRFWQKLELMEKMEGN